MRAVCPVCGSVHREQTWEMKFLVPDTWDLPTNNIVCRCEDCGLIYYDNSCTQTKYNDFYRLRYGFDGNLDPNKQNTRLDEVVLLLNEMFPKDSRILDFGAGTGYFGKRLQEKGFWDVYSVDVQSTGLALPRDVDLLCFNHVLEHLYDIKGTILPVLSGLRQDGRIYAEVPDASRYHLNKELPIADFHQLHVNHFTPSALDRLFMQYGYDRIYEQRVIGEYHNAPAYRAIYQKSNSTLYRSIEQTIYRRVQEKLKRVRDLIKCGSLDREVVVWGCGSYCLHVLAQLRGEIQVAYFVDIDPAFRGTRIIGKPVKHKVDSDHPIVIIAQNQATAIVQMIKDLELKNKVYVI